MAFNGKPQWPWLAGLPLKGTSVLRFSTTATLLAAAGVRADQYQHAALWLGLYGIPVSAGSIFALFQLVGAGPMIAALGLLVTAFFGNPRWLMEERFAHSPTLVWAGNDVFAFVFPALYATVAMVFRLLARFSWPVTILTVVMLASVTGFGPWFALPVIFGLFLWLVYCLAKGKGRTSAIMLAIGAFLGLLTLEFICGTGAGGGSMLAVIGPSPVIRSMDWAFPFLAEPLTPLLANLSLISLVKLIKFAIVFACASVFFVLGTLWVRVLIFADAPRWRLVNLARPPLALAGVITLAGFVLITCCDFRKVAYTYADYDMLRLLWVPLLFVNLALGRYAYQHRCALRKWWGIAIAVGVLFLGGWEYSYYVLQNRLIEPAFHVSATDIGAIRYLNEHATLDDVVLINSDYTPGIKAGVIGHNWGYVSGLGIPAVWLDNRDMAYKFAQGSIWDERHAKLQRILVEPDAKQVRAFLAEEEIDWVYLQGDDELAISYPDATLTPVYVNDAVRLYKVGGK